MLVDTSIWVDHLRRHDDLLASLLLREAVECHPFIVGELACGQLKRREEILALLGSLPQVPVAAHEEALDFVEVNGLAGSGIGWIDAHLLASARLGATPLWTRDRWLALAARAVGVFGEPQG
jgi:predicted nucleic acid-binding protein